ncbi:unnamed protein product, partial [Amoebophrya sp. A120]
NNPPGQTEEAVADGGDVDHAEPHDFEAASEVEMLHDDDIDPLAQHQLHQPAVVVENLRVKFGDAFYALSAGTNLRMQRNQIFCLLGPNGAGKSTCMKVLTGHLRQYDNEDAATPARDEIESGRRKQMIGFCPQENALYEYLTVEEHFLLFMKLRNFEIPASSEEADEDEILEDRDHAVRDGEDSSLFGDHDDVVADAADAVPHRVQHCDTFAQDMQRRLSIGLAFVGDPVFVVLDEPSSGLDPFTRRQLWEFLRKMKEHRTIFFTTHFLDEAEALGDNIAIMSFGGEVKAEGSADFLKRQHNCGYELMPFSNVTFSTVT